MHNTKFCSQLFNKISLNFKQNSLWFDILLTKNLHSALRIFKVLGVISSFFFYNVQERQVRVFLKYINLELPYQLPVFFFFKPSHKLPVSLKKLKRLDKSLGGTTLIVSTSRGLKSHFECIKYNLSGFLFFVIYGCLCVFLIVRV